MHSKNAIHKKIYLTAVKMIAQSSRKLFQVADIE